MFQQALPFKSTWGGRREGAGRKRGNRVSHHPRPRFEKPAAVHVTTRMRSHVRNRRTLRGHRLIRGFLEKAVGKFGLRVIEYAVLGNHVHFIVEADSSVALA